jgi:hypothetical protein
MRFYEKKKSLLKRKLDFLEYSKRQDNGVQRMVGFRLQKGTKKNNSVLLKGEISFKINEKIFCSIFHAVHFDYPLKFSGRPTSLPTWSRSSKELHSYK